MSLSTVSSPVPESRRIRSRARWSGSGMRAISNSVIPRMPFRGVRISWLMLAMKSVLARLAATAAARASRARPCRRVSLTALRLRSPRALFEGRADSNREIR